VETIIVGAAESETAARALNRAAELAKATGSQLIIVTAYGSDDVDVVGVGSDTYVLSTADYATDFVNREAARLTAEFGIDAKGVAGSGKPHTVILDKAKAHDASLIVVGNVRMQGPGRLLGSVANDVAHHAPCDVYIVKTT
jgi:nucleotide-binding universal stress UspA family protein